MQTECPTCSGKLPPNESLTLAAASLLAHLRQQYGAGVQAWEGQGNQVIYVTGVDADLPVTWRDMDGKAAFPVIKTTPWVA